MNYALGYGLPTPLTPERIRDVLDLASSHQRLFAEELDRGDFPGWRGAAPGTADRSKAPGLYTRLQGLLRSAEGRAEYQRAVRAFESRKSKLEGRANIFVKLLTPHLEDLVVEGDSPNDDSDVPGAADDIVERLASKGAWERLSEVLWAAAVQFRNVDRLRACMDRYPDVRPHLEDVAAGLVPLDAGHESLPDLAPPSAGNSGTPVAAVLSAVKNLDRKRLGADDVRALDGAAKLLASIIEGRRGALERALERLDAWRSGHADTVSAVDAMDGRISRLRASVGSGGIGEEQLETILSDIDRVLDIEKNMADSEKNCREALAAKDFSKLMAISRQLATQESEKLDLYMKIGEACNAGAAEPGSPGDTEGHDDDAKPESATDDDPVAKDDPTPETPSPEPEVEDVAGASPEIAPRRPPRQETDSSTPAPPVPEPDLPPPPGAPDSGDGESAAPGDDDEEDGPDDGSPAMEGDGPTPDAAGAVDDESIDAAVMTAMKRRLFGAAYHLARAVPNPVLSPDTVKLAASNYAADAHDV